uniref:Fiber protein n=1 Tax=Canine adenovirus serotype 2 TaxID=10514 RepID=A0A7D4XDT0_ADEC2|nr:fiber protein [Canine adenovirus 2]
MKRTRRALPANYDPVYPYDAPGSSTQPPFFNNKQGLTESPPGTLAVNVSPPLTFSTLGAIKLSTGPGLTLNEGKLQASLGPGLITNTEGQITVENVNKVLSFTSPLHKTENTVSLALGDGLEDENGTLKVTFPTPPPPLQFSPPLTETGGTISLPLQDSMQVTNGKLGVKPTTYAPPLKKTDQQVSLQVGSGLTVINEQLQAVQPPATTYNEPLSKTDNSVSLQVGAGLAVQSGALVATPPPPLTFTSPLEKNENTVSLQVGAGLSVQNNALVATPPHTLTFAYPLVKNDNHVALSAGSGLRISGGSLTVATGPGLSHQNGTIGAVVGAGLKFENNAILAKLGNGLTIRDGAIEATQPPAAPITLWTGPDPSINGFINDTPVIRCFICLTRDSNLVTVNASFVGEGGCRIVSPTQSQFSLIMEFDQFGQLMSTGNINSTTTWGEKPWGNNTVQPRPSHTWKLCMPNREVYSTPAATISRCGLDSIAVDGAPSRSIDCMLIINKPKGVATYTLTFRFLNFNRLSGGTLFKTDVLTFTYVGENQ